MKRIFLRAAVLSLALGLGWYLSFKESPDLSSESQKPRAASNSTSAQTQKPVTTATGDSPAQTQTTRTSASTPTLSRIAASATSAPTHKLHTPGDGLPSASQEQVKKLIEEAVAHEDGGDLAGAIDTNKKILQIDPQAAVTMNVIAGLYGKMNDFETEIQWARKAITTDPNLANAYINYGNALGATGRPRAARKAFLKAIELEPKNPYGVYSLGVLAEQKKDYKTTLQYYQKSVVIDPQFENGYYNSAAMYSDMKQYDKALAALDKVLKLNPNAEDARAMSARIITEQTMAKNAPKAHVEQAKTHHRHHKRMLVKASHHKHRRHKVVTRKS